MGMYCVPLGCCDLFFVKRGKKNYDIVFVNDNDDNNDDVWWLDGSDEESHCFI